MLDPTAPSILDLRKSRNFSDVLSTIFDVVRESFRPLFVAIIYIAGPYLIVGAIAYGMAFKDMTSPFWFEALDVTGGFGGLTTMLSTMAVAVILMLVASLMQMVTVYSFFRFAQRERYYPSVDEVREEMRGTMGMTIGTYILSAMILFVAFLFLFIPGFYLMVPMSLILAIRFNEAGSFGEAMSRCFRLVSERWWWTFGILIIIYLAEATVSGLFSFPVTIISMAGVAAGIEDGNAPLLLDIVIISVIIVSQVASFLVATLLYVATTVLYYNHAERIDASGLNERIESLGGEVPPPPHAG